MFKESIIYLGDRADYERCIQCGNCEDVEILTNRLWSEMITKNLWRYDYYEDPRGGDQEADQEVA